jgi:hypothetical protein
MSRKRKNLSSSLSTNGPGLNKTISNITIILY